MYPILLVVHSWVRWAVVLTALALLLSSLAGWVRAAPVRRLHTATVDAFLGTLYLQVLLGVALYALSPLVRTAWSDPGAAMANAPLRFFMVEHQFAALLTVGLAHVGLKRARNREDPRHRHRTALLVSGFCLLFLVTVIPWPALPYGRALFRL